MAENRRREPEERQRDCHQPYHQQSQRTANSKQNLCVFCHTPHNATSGACCGTFRSKSFSPSHGFSHLTGFLLGRQTPGLIRYRQGALRTC